MKRAVRGAIAVLMLLGLSAARAHQLAVLFCEGS